MSSGRLHITFLGTGTSSGVPMIACNCPVCQSPDARDKRLRSSVLLQQEGHTVVIDTTPDFRYQMLREKVQQLDAVVFTHPHKDHIAGLDDVRPFNFFTGNAIHLHANALTAGALRREFAYAFAEFKYPGVPDLVLHEEALNAFEVGPLQFLPIEVFHHKMPVWGFRIGGLSYVTDANRIEPAEKEKIRGSEVLILNALRREAHLSHFTLQEAIDLVQELEVPQAYFTHMSHQIGLHEAVNAELPPGIQLAYDGLRFSVSSTA